MATLQASVELFGTSLRDRWVKRVDAARRAREPFMAIAKQCEHFISSSCGFMWDEEFQKEYFGDRNAVEVPHFKITINKAFELVNLFGPYLFWRNPHRDVRPYQRIDFDADVFGDPNDPMVQQIHAQAVQVQDQEVARNRVAAQLMEAWLNYTSREQPGTLARHALNATQEALVKGRGCLWAEHYKFPGSDRNMTGLFFDTVENFFVDADCNDPMLESATWIGRRHRTPYWELERRFGHAPGSLREYATESSNENVATSGKRKHTESGEVDDLHKYDGKTHDYIVWYEIWSKGGIGDRSLKDPNTSTVIEDAVGDFAYLAIAPCVPYALNATTQFLMNASSEELLERFAWPIPCHADARWPVALLDFYPLSKSAWPVAPLAPGLGELIALNVLMSALVERGYESRKLLCGYMEDRVKDIKKAVHGTKGTAYIPLTNMIEKSVSDVISYIQQPEVNDDLIKAIEYVSMLFDKRTGLTEFLYAATSTQSRSATDVQSKEERASIRPDKMSNDVADWISEGSDLEKFAAMIYVVGADARPLVGAVGAQLWDQFIATVPIEEIFREMRASVEASDIRKPNKAREADNLQAMMQWMLPALMGYAQVTGNVDPLNAFIEALGDAIELETNEWKLPGPWQVQQDPQQAQMQAAMMEMEIAGKAADTEGKEASAQAKLMDAIKKQVELQAAQSGSGAEEAKAQAEIEKHTLSLLQSQESHEQTMQQDAQKTQLAMALKALEAQQNMATKANEFRFQRGLRQAAKKQSA